MKYVKSFNGYGLRYVCVESAPSAAPSWDVQGSVNTTHAAEFVVAGPTWCQNVQQLSHLPIHIYLYIYIYARLKGTKSGMQMDQQGTSVYDPVMTT